MFRHNTFQTIATSMVAGLLSVVITGGLFGAHAQTAGRSSEQVVAAMPDEEGLAVERVSTRGYDLASLGGRAQVMRRIERAVRRVCGSDEQARLAERTAYEACHDASAADAAGQLRVLVASAGGGLIQVASADPH